MVHRRGTALAVALTCAVAAAGCSDGDTGSSGGSRESPVATPEGPPSASSDASLTEPGTTLGLGEQATVAWRPNADVVAVATVAVRRLVRARLRDLRGWRLDDQSRASALYYAKVTATNAGDEDLGGLALPLYVVDDAGGLVPASTFGADFDRCPSTPLPVPFGPGDSASLCLVFLVPEGGGLAGVELRTAPDGEGVGWVGEVRRPRGR